MKIMYLTDLFPPNDIGGAERIAYYEALLMRKEGHDVIVVTTDLNLNKIGYKLETNEGLKIYKINPYAYLNIRSYSNETNLIKKAVINISYLFNPTCYRLVKNIYDNEKPEIVHIHYIKAISVNSLWALKTNKTKIFMTYHVYQYRCPKGGLVKKMRSIKSVQICKKPKTICKIWKMLYYRMLPKDIKFIAISKFIENDLKANGFKNIVYLPNCITRKPVYESKVTSDNKNQRREILFVGRIEKIKGPEILIDAFVRLGRRDVLLLLIGDGSERKRLAQKYRSEENIIFLGQMSNERVLSYYNRSTFVVVPSLWYEVLNTVIIEAMTCGKPVIASKIPGAIDLIDHGVNGFLFEPGNIDTLSFYINILLSDNDLLARMGKEALKKISIFSERNHLLGLKNLYES